MAWFADLAGKAENLLNNLDEQTGAALRNHNVIKSKKYERHEFYTKPDPNWAPKKRPTPNYLKKSTLETKKYIPKKSSAVVIPNAPLAEKREYPDCSASKRGQHRKYNNTPLMSKTVICELDDDGDKPELLQLQSMQQVTYKMENLEIENAMLKNEHNVLNREVATLIDKLRQKDDGEDVVSVENELNSAIKYAQSCQEDQECNVDKLKSDNHAYLTENEKLKQTIAQLQSDLSVYKDRVVELETRIQTLNGQMQDKDNLNGKTENELRHAQTAIKDLQSELRKSNGECKRLENDWETYKLRVKSMLSAKDKDIKALRLGLNFTEDTKILMEQIDSLQNERSILSEALDRVQSEDKETKRYIESLESRNEAAERVVLALRDALKDERAARNRAEAQCNVVNKELKTIQIETNQTIHNLRNLLHSKDNELNMISESGSSSTRTNETSSLNVADYDLDRNTIDDDKIQHLTEKLMQKQEQIDALKSDNNILKIQMQKLENKSRMELQEYRMKPHTVLQVQETERKRPRINNILSICLPWRMIPMLRQYRLVRIFIITYVIILHFWVLTVLLTSSPDPPTFVRTKNSI